MKSTFGVINMAERFEGNWQEDRDLHQQVVACLRGIANARGHKVFMVEEPNFDHTQYRFSLKIYKKEQLPPYLVEEQRSRVLGGMGDAVN